MIALGLSPGKSRPGWITNHLPSGASAVISTYGTNMEKLAWLAAREPSA